MRPPGRCFMFRQSRSERSDAIRSWEGRAFPPVIWVPGQWIDLERLEARLLLSGDTLAAAEVPDAVGAINDPPVIGSFVASPATVPIGDSMTLTVGDVEDPDGFVTTVQFYWDRDRNNQLLTLPWFADDARTLIRHRQRTMGV